MQAILRHFSQFENRTHTQRSFLARRGAHGPSSFRRNSSGSLAMLAAMRRGRRCQQLARRAPPRFILAIDKGECLPVVIAHDEAGGGFLNGPRWRERRVAGIELALSGRCPQFLRLVRGRPSHPCSITCATAFNPCRCESSMSASSSRPVRARRGRGRNRYTAPTAGQAALIARTCASAGRSGNQRQ